MRDIPLSNIEREFLLKAIEKGKVGKLMSFLNYDDEC